jgi:hypothetical protein
MTEIRNELRQMHKTEERMVAALGKIEILEREMDSVKQEKNRKYRDATAVD